jgi:hypothetical protein
VYFTFLRPCAEVAGVEDEVDWSVPRDLPDEVVELVAEMLGDNAAPAATADDGAYYQEYPT